MDMKDAVLETPWPEEPSPCVQMRVGPLLPEISECAKDLIHPETSSWAQSIIH